MWTLYQSGEGRRRGGLAPCSVFHKASLMSTATILKKPSDSPLTKADAVGLNAAGLVGGRMHGFSPCAKCTKNSLPDLFLQGEEAKRK